jgi:hypothetical protein
MPATQVLQTYLDDSVAALFQDDWPRYAASFALPFTMITEASVMTVNTEADLREGYDAMRATIATQRLTDVLRLAETAAELGETLISGRYITHFLAGAHRIVPPYRSTISLRRTDNRWQAISITNSLANMQWPIHLPRPDPLLEGETP